MKALMSTRPGPPETLELVDAPDPVAEAGEVVIAVKAAGVNFPDVLIIDARAAERYRGEAEPIDPRAGHIPGALNFPYAQALDAATGTFRKPEELKSEFDKFGAKDAETIISYCGSGITACTNIFALRLAGYEAILYEGSWSDWSSDLDLQASTSK